LTITNTIDAESISAKAVSAKPINAKPFNAKPITKFDRDKIDFLLISEYFLTF
jgi:hypothetical protein